MPTDLITRRDQALTRHDTALERWPDRAGAGFATELAAVVDELGKVAAALDAGRTDPLERSRTWRFVGDALFDLARGKESEPLKRAAAAYESAEKLLDEVDAPLERAKLDFNYANTLRGMSQGRDRALLEEASLRYQMALGAFRRHAPNHADTVQAAMDTLQPQLKMLDTFDRVRAGYDGLRGAAADLARAPDDPAVQHRTRELLETMKRGRAGLVGDAMAAVQDFGRSQPLAASKQLGEMIDQLQSAAGFANDPFQRLFPMLLARFQADIKAGRVAAERVAALEPILGEVQKLVNQPDTDLPGVMSRGGKMRELMAQMVGLLGDPSTGQPPPPAGSRAEGLMKYEGALAQYLAAEQQRPNLGPTERDLWSQLFEELAETRSAPSNQKTMGYEKELLRPLALRIGQFSLRHHLTVARTYWALSPKPPDPSSLYACGASGSGSLLDEVAVSLGLTRTRAGAAADAGQERWNAIVASYVVVCDLRAPRGPALAAACYEIGLAKALGRALVIVAAPGAVLPFDIEVEPVELSGAATDRDALAAAIDRALYSPPHREADSSLEPTIAELRHRYGAAAGFEVRKSVELAQQATADPIEVRRRIDTLLGFVGSNAERIIFPAWPGGYPDPGARRLFHVMPFGEKWSNDVRDAVARACGKRVRYVRGDEVADPRMIRSIWDEICRASHVLVDLSAFNANVALELGLAHGLGRHCLVVRQPGTVEEDNTVKQLFPAIRRLRVERYTLARDDGALRKAIDKFIATDRPAA